ncbi:MAG: hypothetical protein ACYC2T_08925 [Bacillota bacterium]
MAKKLLLITVLISIFLLGGCGNKNDFSWKSPVKEDGPWRVSATANLVVEEKQQTLTYTPKIENISGGTVNNVSYDVILADNEDWPETKESSGILGSENLTAGKVKEFSLTTIYHIDKIIKKEQMNSIKIKLQWDDVNLESGQSTAIISF